MTDEPEKRTIPATKGDATAMLLPSQVPVWKKSGWTIAEPKDETKKPKRAKK